LELVPGKDWHLFFCSEAPGLVFSMTYLRGKLAPSAFPSTGSGLRLPPQISHEKDGGLPPVTSEKAPALSFLNRGVGERFTSLRKLYLNISYFLVCFLGKAIRI
jgi:hypothetical protein